MGRVPFISTLIHLDPIVILEEETAVRRFDIQTRPSRSRQVLEEENPYGVTQSGDQSILEGRDPSLQYILDILQIFYRYFIDILQIFYKYFLDIFLDIFLIFFCRFFQIFFLDFFLDFYFFKDFFLDFRYILDFIYFLDFRYF